MGNVGSARYEQELLPPDLTISVLRWLDPTYGKNNPFQEFLRFFYMMRIRVFHLHNKKEKGMSPFYFLTVRDPPTPYPSEFAEI